MEKEFVPYELAVKLKKLGFDEPCFGYWYTAQEEYKKIDIQLATIDFLEGEEDYILAPTFQQAFRWFREKHNLYSEINLDSYKEPYSLKITIKHLDETNTFVDKEYYPYSNGIGDIDNKTYEEAEQECLKKLIEIVKNK